LATPGKSNHNLGIAIDIANASGARLAWLLANEHLYGFSHELDSEPWHIRYVAGDATPDAVKAWKATQV
jgi:LAS superfamily LD-carboxypeptidase LdcB